MKIFLNSIVLILLFTLSIKSPAQKFSRDNTLEVLTWNVEWFGYDHEEEHKDKGPNDEELQLSNVIEILKALDFPDIIVFQEICERSKFEEMAEKSNYNSYLSPGSDKYQKIGIFYSKKLQIIEAPKQILVAEKHQFAQRPPVYASFHHNGIGEFSIIGLHLKAHIPSNTEEKKQDSWERRKKASELIDQYIEQSLIDKKVIVLGDWNDDIDQSNFNSNPSPFTTILNKNSGRFVTEYLSLTYNQSSKYGSVIDHIYITDNLFENFIYSGIVSVKELQTSYIKETSDHYPVYMVLK